MSFAEQNQQTTKQWVKELLVEIRNEDSIELEGGKNYGRTKTSKLVR